MQALQAEIAARSRIVTAPRLDLEALTFPEQRAFIEDDSPLAIALCSRRAGKSKADMFILARTAIGHDESISVFIAKSRPAAKKLMWAPLQRLLTQLGIPFVPNATELTIRLLHNGSEIWLAGASDLGEVEKLRGHPFAVVIIDEAQSIREEVLQTLVDDILQWALIDREGKLRLSGTPPPIPGGYFVEAFTGKRADGTEVKGWSRHHWNIFQNVKLPKAAAYIERICEARGLTPDHPTYRREILGELVHDRNALVLSAFDLDRNVWSELPGGSWLYVIGVDIGWNDSDAIEVLGWSSDEDPGLYHVDEYLAPHQFEEDLANVLWRFIERYHPMAVVCDTGGNRKTVEGVAHRLQYPIKPAHKPSVVDQFSRLNDEFRAGRLFAKKGSAVAHDAQRLAWRAGRVGKDVDDGFHSDALPALSYAYTEARHYYYQPKPDKPKKTALEKELERW